MKDVKIIALDMDGVVNSDELILSWVQDKKKEVRREYSDEIQSYFQVVDRVRDMFDEEFSNGEELIFPTLAERITRICDETDAYILWTSTWRKLERYRNDMQQVKRMFNKRGLPGSRLIAYAPSIGTSWGGRCRGSEIAVWIKDNQEYNVIKCAVIDDRIDAGYNLPDNARYFNTNEYIGITQENVQDIIAYLNGD